MSNGINPLVFPVAEFDATLRQNRNNSAYPGASLRNQELAFLIQQKSSLSVTEIVNEIAIPSLNKTTSIYFIREEIRNILSDFKLPDNWTEGEFIYENEILIDSLPHVADFIKRNLSRDVSLELQLLDEGADWKTLFINIYCSISWEAADSFVDQFWSYLSDSFPECVSMLNISFVPNEF